MIIRINYKVHKIKRGIFSYFYDCIKWNNVFNNRKMCCWMTMKINIWCVLIIGWQSVGFRCSLNIRRVKVLIKRIVLETLKWYAREVHFSVEELEKGKGDSIASRKTWGFENYFSKVEKSSQVVLKMWDSNRKTE